MKVIACTIDLMKIDKSKIKEHSNGAKYYPITVILNDEPDKYGQDAAIANGQTKEEREAKTKQTYIGNGKTIYEKKPDVSESIGRASIEKKREDINMNFNDLPF